MRSIVCVNSAQVCKTARTKLEEKKKTQNMEQIHFVMADDVCQR